MFSESTPTRSLLEVNVTATATKMSLENKHLRNGNFCDYCFFLASFIVDRARWKWTRTTAVEVNIETERFTVVCSCCR